MIEEQIETNVLDDQLNALSEDLPTIPSHDVSEETKAQSSIGNNDDIISIYRKSVSLSSSARSKLEREQMMQSVVTKFRRFSTIEVFTHVDNSYTIEHDDYETVVFENDGIKRLQFLEGRLNYTRSDIAAKLSDSLEISCNLSGVRFDIRQCEQHQKYTTIHIYFDMNDPLILDSDDGFNRRFTVDRWGVYGLIDDLAVPPQWQLAKKWCDCNRRNAKRTRHFVVKPDWLGYEIISAKIVEQMIQEATATNTIFIHRESDAVTWLHRVSDWVMFEWDYCGEFVVFRGKCNFRK